jgi:hypothetical protein
VIQVLPQSQGSQTKPQNNNSRNNSCLAKAAGSALFHGAVDAVALVPGVGTAAVAISTGVSIGDTIVEGNLTDVGMTAAGSLLTLAAKPANALFIASYSVRAAEAIPVLGTAFGAFQLGLDGYKAFQQYQACVAGGN